MTPLTPASVGSVETVLGSIDPNTLGDTLMHDHLVVDWAGALGEPRLDTIEPLDDILRLLRVGADSGVGTIVDPAPEQFAAQPWLLRTIAERAPVHIVAATGLFAADMLPLPGWVFPPNGAEQIAEKLIDSATNGIGGTGIRPGIFKVATSGRAVFEIEERILQGAAIAQRATGLPITTHTHYTKLAEQQVDIFEAAGADLSRVVIGHIGWGSSPADFELHKRLVDRGVTIGLDLVGEPPCSTEDYATIASDLVEAGYASQIVLSHDTVLYPRGLADVFGPEWTTGDLTVVHDQLWPLMRSKGVTEAAWRQMISDNPRRLLTRVAAS
jgi:phosphotriesterase-related protein